MKKILILLLSCVLTACAIQPPDNLFSTTPELLQARQLQTRKYDNISETDLLSASANVLQDMGYTLAESETKLGILTAKNDRDATDGGEVVGAIILAALFGVSTAISKDQTITASLAVKPKFNDKGEPIDNTEFVRVIFQRIVRLTNNQTRVETLKDPELYKGFFDKLSKSVFLEGQKI